MLATLALLGCSSCAGNPPSGGVSVFAAKSLTEALTASATALQAEGPNVHVTFNFAGTQALVQQLQQGSPADVFASADTANMAKVHAAGLVDAPVTFARNTLEIAVAKGNPKHVTALADLGRPDLLVVLADPSVPAGKYAQEALRKATTSAQPKSLELDVKAALAKVAAGEADATIVYATDIKAAPSSVTGVAIADEHNVIATYPVAVVKAAKNKRAADAFVKFLVSNRGQAVLRDHGFLAAG